MGNLFSNKKTTQQTTNSNQSGSTENNLWDNPGLQSFLSGYNNQFQGAANFNAPVNQYQTGAANAQTGVSGGLGSAFQTANQVGSDGITKANIDKYMSPYVQGVINPTMQVQNQQNQQALSNLSGNQAAKGALGNNTGSAAAYMASVQPAQQAQIAGLYQQGYGQATSTAAQDAALRLQGAGTAGSLTGAATGANAALGNMGQNIWQSNYQNQITPYTLYNQGVQGFTGLGGLAGQNYTGTSSGTSNGTSSETPSLGSVLAGLLGTGISAYKADGGPVNDNAPIMPYEPSEAPQETLIDKVLKASHALREFRDGGAATKADGGMVGYDPTKWVTQVHAPSSGPSVDYKKAGAGLSGMGSSLGKMSNDGDMGGSAIAAQQAELGRGLQSIMQRPAFGSGGDVDGDRGGSEFPAEVRGVSDVMRPFMPSSPVDMEAPSGGVSDVMRPFMPTAPMTSGLPPMEPASPRPATAVMGQAYRADPVPSPSMAGATARAQEQSMGSKFYDMIGRPFSGGVWDGKEATAGQRAGAALTQIGNGPFAGFGQHILEQQKMRYNEMNAERAAAELMGQYKGQDVLAKQIALGTVQTPNGPQPTLASSQFDRQMVMDKAKIDHMMTPELTRQLESAGYVRGTPEFKKAAFEILNKGRGDKSETEFDKTIAKASAQDFEKRGEAIRNSQSQLLRIDQFEKLVNDPNVRTGKFAETELEAKKMLQVMGFDVKGIPEGEALRALGNQFALSMRSTAGGEGMPGAMSDADRNFLMATVPGLGNTKGGTSMLIKSMRDTEQYKIRANTEAARYIEAKRSNAGLGEYMTEWMKQNPMERVVPGHAETRAAAQKELDTHRTLSVPDEARKRLEANASNPKAVADFNATFNGGKPGLAESLLAGTPPKGSQKNPHDGVMSAGEGEFYTHNGKLYQRKRSINPFASDPEVPAVPAAAP